MLFTSGEQFVMLAVVLLAGWLLGLASAPRAAGWKRRARAQAKRFAAYHRDVEDRLRAAQQRATDLNDELATLRADHGDAERTIARLRGGVALNGAAAVEPAFAPAEPLVTPPAPPMSQVAPNDRPRDDLTRIGGIDPMLAMRLFSLGLVRFEDIERLSVEDELALEPRLDLPAGYIARHHWRGAATALRAGSEDAGDDRLGAVPARGPAAPPPPPA